MKCLICVLALSLIGISSAQAHLNTEGKRNSLTAQLKSQQDNLAHAEGVVAVCERLAMRGNSECAWHRKAVKWLGREIQETARAIEHAQARKLQGTLQYWINRQISAAESIGRNSSGDPWPNCPDPYDSGGYSWYDTVQCENGGNWYDSPGYYRCGLQFDPMWERIYGRLCP